MNKPEPKWFPEDDGPINDGWYAIQRKDGSLCIRAWGNGMWWIPLRDGWLSGLPPGFRWMGPLEPMEWNTPRDASEVRTSPAAPKAPERGAGTKCACGHLHWAFKSTQDAGCQQCNCATWSEPPAHACSACGGTGKDYGGYRCPRCLGEPPAHGEGGGR